jgi:hypothetical protein
MNPRDTSGCNQIPESQTHLDWRESKSRSQFFRSLLGEANLVHTSYEVLKHLLGSILPLEHTTAYALTRYHSVV